jgi:hypothetical protein
VGSVLFTVKTLAQSSEIPRGAAVERRMLPSWVFSGWGELPTSASFKALKELKVSACEDGLPFEDWPLLCPCR